MRKQRNENDMEDKAKEIMQEELNLLEMAMEDELKLLEDLRKLCVNAMILVDGFVELHKDTLVASLRQRFGIPDDWQVKILSNGSVITGSFRSDDTFEWKSAIYNDMKWYDLLNW